MGGASSFLAILAISGFLVLVWLASKVSRTLRISSIVMEIAVGLLLSPAIAAMMPSEYASCYHQQVTDCDSREGLEEIKNLGTEYCDINAYKKAGLCTDGSWCEERRLNDAASTGSWEFMRRLGSDATGKTKYNSYLECLEKSCAMRLSTRCSTTPDVFTLIGHTGVALMIFESGMHFDFEKAKVVGGWACVVAVLGTFLPLVTGMLLTMAFGYDMFPDGLAAGTALAPTSVGIALRLLHEAKQLQSNFGQAIITAAFVDDILSLVLFNILFSLGDEFSFMVTIFPALMGILFMVAACSLAVKFWPFVVKKALSVFPEGHNVVTVSTQDQVLFLIMFVVLIVYSVVTHYCGTHLWGCFIAGMSFACVPHAHHIWVRQTKRYTVWMIRIFFACTVAFAIPIDKLMSVDALWKGVIMGFGPCILTKVVCAFFMGPPKFVIGWAMVGRAEFAYLIAQMAAAANMMGPEVFSIVIWALLCATIFAPFLFRYVLIKYSKSLPKEESESDDPAETETNEGVEEGATKMSKFLNMLGDTRGQSSLPDFEGMQEVAALKSLVAQAGKKSRLESCIEPPPEDEEVGDDGLGKTADEAALDPALVIKI